jgi:hypothetical protein
MRAIWGFPLSALPENPRHQRFFGTPDEGRNEHNVPNEKRKLLGIISPARAASDRTARTQI